MTSIAIAGLPTSRKTPGVYLAVLLGGTPTSAGAAAKKIIVVGNKITTALTGSAPTFSVAAGTQADASPVFLPSADDAATFFGRGSEPHRMALGVFAQYPDALVYGESVAESAGSRADATLTFVNAATAAFTIRITLNGKVMEVPVASGDAIAAISEACAQAILDEPDLPVTAQFTLGVTTITAKHTGPRGNDLGIRAQFIDAAGTPTEITSSATTSPGATTAQFGGGAAYGSGYALAGGTTADDFTSALAAIAGTRYDRIVVACRDTTNLDLVAAQADSMAGVTTQLRQQFVYGSPATLGTATTLATGRNDSRGQCVWHYASPLSAEECAAQVTAARLAGDSLVGGLLVGEATRPSANLDGCLLRSVPVQPFVADQPTATEVESALNNGLTALIPAPSNPGFCAISRSITTRSLAGNTPNYSVLDTSNVTVCDYVADDLQSDLGTVFAGKNLAADTSDGLPPTAANVVTPSMIRSRIAYKLGTYEENGIVRDVNANLPLLVVVENLASPGRVDAEIPCEPVPGLHVLGGNLRQVA